MTAAVGLFGLGLIGTAIAGRLGDAGHPVIGHDPDPDRRDAARRAGVDAVEDPAAVWQAAHVIVLAVFDVGQVEAVVRAAPEGGPWIVVVTSTCDPDRVAALGEEASSRGIRLVEASVSGTSRQLADGRALIVTGGHPEDVGAADAVLAALSPERRHAGPLGDANRTKLAINLVLGLNRASLAEGLVLAARMGLDADAFLETLRASAAHSAVMDVKGGMMVRGDFTPQGRVAQSAKDFALILAAGGGALPLAGLYADLMQDCLAHGEADLDNAAVIRAIRRRVESGTRRGGDG